MSTYFKAVRPDGTDFHTGTIDYAAALGGDPVTLPEVTGPQCCTSTVLHAATVPAETLVGGFWPCRLFEVTGTPVADEGHKRGFFSLAVVREVDAHQALGPQGEQAAALIDRAGKLTVGEAENLDAAAHAATAHAAAHADRDAAGAAAWAAASDAARNAAWGSARDAAWAAARDAAWATAWAATRGDARVSALCAAAGRAARDAARDAAFALVVRDLISKEHYDLLTGPWAQVIGPAHPEDK